MTDPICTDEKKQDLSSSRESVGENKPQETPTWRQFTQNSTFHGIKYVFDDTTWFRKLFWLLIILGAITFFVGQVGLRIRDYYKYQAVTSVKRMSSEKLQFPAITLCNLNQFRISEAHSMGLYDYFNQQLRSSEEISDPALQGITNTTEVVARLGHQLDQVIDSCKWRGQSCEMSSDFVSRLLDIGLCHTFNHDAENVKFVDQEGMEGGLKLLLNIEVFEHMRGSNLDSGVKFLLHQPDEVPSLKNRGFVATPGQHTFVAIKLSEISGLPAPWGNCVEGIQSVANCKHDCLADDFIQHCNCSDTSMVKSTRWPECGLPTKLTCGCNENNKDSSTCGANCTCPDPCREIVFRPSLSSSMLSAINLDMFALKAPGVYETTNTAFLDASETSLRLSPKFDSDFILPSLGLVESFDTIRQLHTHYNLANEDSYISMIKPFGESFYHSLNSFDPVILHMTVEESFGGPECAPDVSDVAGFINKVVKLVYIIDFLKTKGINDKETCQNDTDYQEFLVGVCSDAFHNHDCDWATESIIEKTPVCNNQWTHAICCLAGDIQTYIDRPDFDETLPVDDLKKYNDETNVAYMHGVLNQLLQYHEDGVPCSDFIDFLEEDVVIFSSVKRHLNILNTSTIDADILYQFVDTIYNTTATSYNDVKNNTLKTLLLSGVEKSLAPLTGIRNITEQFTRQSNFTVKGLAMNFVDPAITRQIASVITETEREIELLINIQRVLNNLILYMEEYTMILLGGTKISLLHGTQTAQTQMISFLVDHKTKDNYAKFGIPRCNNYTMPEPRSAEMEFYIQIACTFSELVATDIANMSVAVKEFELNYGVLQTALTKYDDNTQMKQDFYKNNFMQVDLYYETLQYEYIEEQKAFVIGSLFSEVGGFLGLLLGASIITMCELFDHLLLLLGQRLTARKQLKPMNQATHVRKGNVEI